MQLPCAFVTIICHIVKWELNFTFSTVITCPALNSITNGSIEYLVAELKNETERFAIGVVAQYSCASGYSLIGSFNRTCIEDDEIDIEGVWSGEDPTCLGNAVVTFVH